MWNYFYKIKFNLLLFMKHHRTYLSWVSLWLSVCICLWYTCLFSNNNKLQVWVQCQVWKINYCQWNGLNQQIRVLEWQFAFRSSMFLQFNGFIISDHKFSYNQILILLFIHCAQPPSEVYRIGAGLKQKINTGWHARKWNHGSQVL